VVFLFFWTFCRTIKIRNVIADAEAIVSFLNNSERCRRFGARRRKIVQEKFSIDVAIAKTEEVYAECREKY